MSTALQAAAPGHHLKLDADGVLNVDHRMYLELKSRQHCAQLVNFERIVALD